MRQVDEVKLLTYTHTYVKDDRYRLVHEAGDRWQRWQLVIGNVQTQDVGEYRCQVATTPPLIMDVTLSVTEPRARVVDERGEEVREKHYNSGSMIELKCVIDQVPFPPGPVTWRRGATTLSFNTSRGGISVKGDAASGFIASRLYVANAAPTDSGRYSCWYANYTSDTVTVHVIAGENSAFMQHDALPETPTAAAGGGAAAPLQVLWWWPLLIVVTLATCDFFHTLLTWVDSTTSYCRLHHHPLLHTSTT
ncbi:obscurin-like [Homarus americanus]|uniref:obscurin-like n=1 Tax=Homarus americanus TaxID=6706 RepID=UPI001C469C3E|nr:obscurin-like [Homarus americanus]